MAPVLPWALLQPLWPSDGCPVHSHPGPQPSAQTALLPASRTAPPIQLPSSVHLDVTSSWWASLTILSKVPPSIPSLRFIILHCTFQQHYKIYKSNKNIKYKNQIKFLLFPCCLFGRQNGPRKEVHALIPGTCDYIMLHGKRDFVAVITGLKIGRLSWIIQEAQSNHRSP